MNLGGIVISLAGSYRLRGKSLVLLGSKYTVFGGEVRKKYELPVESSSGREKKPGKEGAGAENHPMNESRTNQNVLGYENGTEDKAETEREKMVRFC